MMYSKAHISPFLKVENQEQAEGPYGLEVLIYLVSWYHRQEINV